MDVRASLSTLIAFIFFCCNTLASPECWRETRFDVIIPQQLSLCHMSKLSLGRRTQLTLLLSPREEEEGEEAEEEAALGCGMTTRAAVFRRFLPSERVNGCPTLTQMGKEHIPFCTQNTATAVRKQDFRQTFCFFLWLLIVIVIYFSLLFPSLS